MMMRKLGRSNIEVSAMGMGCWAIGGHFLLDGKADGWGSVDDAESIRAIQRAVDLGVNFFDTSDAYGTGHSERILGQALADIRDQVVIATKFGFTYDEAKRELLGTNVTPEYIRWACEQSLRRLNTDYIDLYQLHCGASPEEAEAVFDTLDALVDEGKIRAYGWSTGDLNNAQLLANRSNAVSVQCWLHVLGDYPEMLETCTRHNLAYINNSPLANGLLTGKYSPDFVFPSDDFRGAGHEWAPHFVNGRPKREMLDQLDAVREVLTAGGRTLVQGALAWIWARGEITIPIPGFKTVAQAEENAKAMQFGPLTADQMRQINELLSGVAA